ncbi:hypothetical protein [Neptunomonas antarctica]|uniref:Uncharacterized protein n=1 Tax=Neptunomonas antarctica TaxID=619304 RepID=A0A1N7LIG6_9GAMM|nr:hypothetical protein [Neptunomonas antarctica]SIS73574.1 hypothetical protein SAMN05421760_10454 [Neptunomonas antarctica]
MGIQDREWYREAQKGKQRRGQWNGNNQNSPLNKTTLLYLSLSITDAKRMAGFNAG